LKGHAAGNKIAHYIVTLYNGKWYSPFVASRRNVLKTYWARRVASFLYGVRPVDPVAFLVVPALTGVAAAIAGIATACVDPVNALRRQ